MNKKGFSILIAVLIILLIMVTGAAGWGVWQLRQIEKEISNADLTDQLSNQSSATKNTADVQSGQTTTVTDNSKSVKQIEDSGITWTNPPQEIADQPIYNDQALKFIDQEKIYYYKIGQTESGAEIILSLFPVPGMGVTYKTFRFFKDQNQTISFIQNSSDSDRDILEDNASIFKDNTKYENVKLRSVAAPDFLDYNGEVLQKDSAPYTSELGAYIYQENAKLTKDRLTEYGQLYIQKVESSDYLSYTLQDFVLRLPDYTLAYYTVKIKFITDNNIPVITWSDGTKNATIYTKGGLGGHCGVWGTYDAIVKDAKSSRFIEAGTTSDGAKVYFPQADGDLLYQDAYKNYTVGRDNSTGGDKAIAQDVFVTKKPIFIYKDGVGRYIFFYSQDFAALAECGKPVIYLYPEKTTGISVEVGARINQSEPEYFNGWQVVAQPNGKLTIGDKSYDSLYWEGLGIGEYPRVETGFVVETKYIKQTLKDHLSQLGLNSKESSDFMAFWLPKMPKEKYTRLTWFGTKEMDELAPLTVNPKPDTSIRIFLDYQGLDKPIDLPAQKLSAPTRQGFTLVEWGGLLVK